ncbi:hypothetical protein FOL47_010488 [Perkinsus chesapeaki]|uniref:Uncharacterized protein n=1 Tax=Perkinsus chesapeaki TaxID=330153 RepID=A0A7J6L3M2_PERCH|nr:hypothetical protein FOL47_010488 [Perkinsus chesapeaki]
MMLVYGYLLGLIGLAKCNGLPEGSFSWTDAKTHICYEGYWQPAGGKLTASLLVFCGDEKPSVGHLPFNTGEFPQSYQLSHDSGPISAYTSFVETVKSTCKAPFKYSSMSYFIYNKQEAKETMQGWVNDEYRIFEKESCQ